MDNSGREYQDISFLVDRLLTFRDSFAHPKACQEIVQDSVQSDLEPIPGISWETEVEGARIERDYRALEEYSIRLLDTAAACLEDTLTRGWDVWQQRYPHLDDLHLEAAYLRGFLHSPSHSSIDISL
jgi:hypothetical protein